MQAVETGEIPRNHQILREIAGLCSRLPIGSDSTAGTKFLKNTNDALLISYMAMMTKGFNAMSEVRPPNPYPPGETPAPHCGHAVGPRRV